jgi:hypothetical protein
LVACVGGEVDNGPADGGGAGSAPKAGTGSQMPSGGTGGTGAAVGGSGGSAPTNGGTGVQPTGGTGTAGTGAGVAGTQATGGNPAGGSGGSVSKPIPDFQFPAPTGSTQSLSSTREVDDFDGGMQRFVGTGDLGGTSGGEGQDPLFSISAGGSLKNVIIGDTPADGIHCEGSCTLENVWFENVNDDAITFLGSSSSNTYRLTGGGARSASDKVIQHNGGGTAYIKNFLVQDFGKLYRSCGNCDDQYTRHVEFDTIVANGTSGVLAGVNTSYNDTAKFVNIFADFRMDVCERYEGNNSGDDDPVTGEGPDGSHCLYSPTLDVTWH